MIFVPICSSAAFIVILADLDWKWCETTPVMNFVHSIFGIVTIGFSIIQVIEVLTITFCFSIINYDFC
jgi:hypothetical protein